MKRLLLLLILAASFVCAIPALAQEAAAPDTKQAEENHQPTSQSELDKIRKLETEVTFQKYRLDIEQAINNFTQQNISLWLSFIGIVLATQVEKVADPSVRSAPRLAP